MYTHKHEYIHDIWSCQSSDLGTLRHYCTMLCGYFHSGPETRTHLSDCVNEQYRGLRAIYVCNRHGWLRAVSEYNSDIPLVEIH